MSIEIKLLEDGNILLRMPIQLRLHGGRKKIITPESKQKDEVEKFSLTATNSAVVTALARAFHWQKLLDDGTYKSAIEIAQELAVNPSYVRRMLRLCQISPKIISMFIHGEAPDELSLNRLIKSLPEDWAEQEKELLGKTV